MILVVFAHCLFDLQSSSLINLITDTIYVFHMPAFVFTTGFLSKSNNSRSGKSLLKLFSAYIIFNTVMMLYQFFANGTNFSLMSPYNSCWYLLSMIVWRWVADKIPKMRCTVAVAFVVALAVGFFGDVSNILAAARTVALFPLFLIGYMLPTENVEKFYKNRRSTAYIGGFLLLAETVLIALLTVKLFGISDGELQMEAYQSFPRIVIRLIIFAVSILFIAGLVMVTPDKRIPWLTKIGQNTLAVFLLHRIPTIIVSKVLSGYDDWIIIVFSALATVAIVTVCSFNAVSKAINATISTAAKLLSGTDFRHRRAIQICAITLAVTITVIPAAQLFLKSGFEATESGEKIYSHFDASEKAEFDDDMKLLFAGDLILLEDQVKRGFDGEKYCFDDVFEYAKKYISEADIAVGVFEGPMAGEEAGYSTSNFDDGKKLALNYPYEFGEAVKKAGFDIVTTANNHLLDKDVSGLLNTLDALDRIGIEHIGSYRSESEKNNVKIIEQCGIKIALLAYTYGSNGYTEEDFLSKDMSYLTSITADPDGENFDRVKKSVEEDFKRAKQEKPDIIAVVPHMGTQFSDEPDSYQTKWNEIFLSCGADVILNDHTHSVQPVEVIKRNGCMCAIVNCPGNFANIYRENNGDASAMTEIYIDKTTKSVTGVAIIPMWTQARQNGNYRALPVYDILHNETLYGEISTYDLERVDEVNRHITSVMLGDEIPLDMVRKRYYITADGWFNEKIDSIELSGKAKNTVLYSKLTSAAEVCYVGDSVTEGTRNGGYGWYCPIEDLSAKALEYAKGGGTVKTILPNVAANSDFYVVALGTNDVRYRDESICAMTAEEYISELDSFVNRISKTNPTAEFAFVAPWMALENDTASALSVEERDSMLAEYSSALEKWCVSNGYIYSNPNPYIAAVMKKYIVSDYMMDYIHPNSTKGIQLYAEAVIENSKTN